jgi:tRNA pseudouridine55 synthase
MSNEPIHHSQVHGVLLLDKPQGITSNAALQRTKRLFNAAKAGHTGTLDPLATGLLPVCFGEATKFSGWLLHADKTYRARFRLGETTSTGDAEGEIVARSPVEVTRAQVESCLQRFTGEISQKPPMLSALKHKGRPLYRYARAGVEVARDVRTVSIRSIQLQAIEASELDLMVTCSKGTYLRVLAEDVGAALGCGAHLKALRRVRVGEMGDSEALELAELETMSLPERCARLRSVDDFLQVFPTLILEEDSSRRLTQGQPVWVSSVRPVGTARIYSNLGHFLGIGEIDDQGRVQPKRLMATA